MKTLLSSLSFFYSRLLLLYPKHFRKQFADEMQGVFEQILNDSISTPGKFWLTVLREFGALPASLLREHWREWVNATNGVTGFLEDEHSSSWAEALLTALPFSLLLLTPFLQLGAYLAPIIIGLALIAMLIAWRKKMPRWSAGWLSLLLVAIVSFLSSYIFMYTGEWNTPQALATHIMGEVLLPVGLGIVLYAIYQYDTLTGMLMVLFLFLFFDPFALEFVPEPLNTIVRAATQLVVVVAVLWLVRLGKRTTGVVLLIVASFAIGMALALASEYGNNFTNYKPSLINVARHVLPNMLSSLSLLIGPLLLRAVGDIGRQGGKAGRVGHGLALLGLSLILAGAFGSYRLFLPDDLSTFRDSMSTWFTAVIWGGVALYFGGLLLTGLAARRSGLPLNSTLFSFIVVLLFLAPLVFQLPGIISNRALPALVPGSNNLIYLRQLSESWALIIGSTLGLVWLGLGAGVIALLSHKPSTPAAEPTVKAGT